MVIVLRDVARQLGDVGTCRMCSAGPAVRGSGETHLLFLPDSASRLKGETRSSHPSPAAKFSKDNVCSLCPPRTTAWPQNDAPRRSPADLTCGGQRPAGASPS